MRAHAHTHNLFDLPSESPLLEVLFYFCKLIQLSKPHLIISLLLKTNCKWENIKFTLPNLFLTRNNLFNKPSYPPTHAPAHGSFCPKLRLECSLSRSFEGHPIWRCPPTPTLLGTLSYGSMLFFQILTTWNSIYSFSTFLPPLPQVNTSPTRTETFYCSLLHPQC